MKTGTNEKLFVTYMDSPAKHFDQIETREPNWKTSRTNWNQPFLIGFLNNFPQIHSSMLMQRNTLEIMPTSSGHSMDSFIELRLSTNTQTTVVLFILFILHHLLTSISKQVSVTFYSRQKKNNWNILFIDHFPTTMVRLPLLIKFSVKIQNCNDHVIQCGIKCLSNNLDYF